MYVHTSRCNQKVSVKMRMRELIKSKETVRERYMEFKAFTSECLDFRINMKGNALPNDNIVNFTQ